MKRWAAFTTIALSGAFGALSSGAAANVGRAPKHPLVTVAAGRGSFWYRDAVCETGHDPPYWNYGKPGSGHGGSAYEGGIAFAPSTWRWWGGEIGAYPRYQHAYDAPAGVQAAAAQWGLVNIGKWGCVWKIT